MCSSYLNLVSRSRVCLQGGEIYVQTVRTSVIEENQSHCPLRHGDRQIRDVREEVGRDFWTRLQFTGTEFLSLSDVSAFLL